VQVLYDISVLGVAQNNAGARTGIYRAVESLALALARSDEVDLCFAAGKSWQVYAQSGEYLRQHPAYAGRTLLPTGGNTTFAVPLARALARLEAADPGSVRVRAARATLRTFLRACVGQAPTLRGVTLQRSAIYHSPFFPVPARTAWAPDTPRVLTIYDLIPILQPRFFTEVQLRAFEGVVRSIPEADHIVCISEATKLDVCRELHVQPERVTVTPLAAAPDIFFAEEDPERIHAVRLRYGIPAGEYILSVNTLEPRKNLAHAIRSFVQLLEASPSPNVNLVLVGSAGWKHEEIFEAAAASKLARRRVIMTGFVPDADLAALYSGAAFFVYPSFHEGFGLPPLEAMQCGLPVITSNVSSLPEVVGDAGLLIDPRDPNELTEAMRRLLDDTALRRSLSERSMVRARQFTWERTARATVAAYHAAAGSPRL
jgi:glycosyltransferase involved in cell wall biosynthesis